ncbi:MAG TPA: CoA activase, partial [Spirochaetia bacterium]|nr:CoA activase [Spirochaetia bacterium]
DGRTLLIPNWDPLTSPILAANLQRAGIDARVLEEDETKIRAAMRLNTGQCIPLNIIVEEFVDYIRAHDLDPARTLLWTAQSNLACNFALFAPYMKTLLERYGGGMERAAVYEGDFFFLEISPIVALRAYFAYLSGGMLRRIGCTIRPYEANAGDTDRVIDECRSLLVESFGGGRGVRAALSEVTARFHAIPRICGAPARPKVAIFGDLYVRDNEVMNGNLIRTIEEAGGEVVTTPYNEYLKTVAPAYFAAWARGGELGTWIEFKSLLAVVEGIERSYQGILDGYRLPKTSELTQDPVASLARFHVRIEQEGESYDNLLKILHLVRDHPDVSLFVQTSPAFCCPSLITESMGATIERLTGVPVVTITYDGTSDIKNELVVPYLSFPRKRPAAARDITRY